jgi:hypothetical protein
MPSIYDYQSNVDDTLNQSGELQYFMDLQVQTGTQHHTLRFFLSNLGENKVILGYSWFAAFQPRINWKRGWIDHNQLPVILRSPDVTQARFLPRQINKPRALHTDRILICRMVTKPKHTLENPNIPLQYCMYSRVFSEEASHKFPPSRPFDRISCLTFHLHHPSSSDVVCIHHDGLIYPWVTMTPIYSPYRTL